MTARIPCLMLLTLVAARAIAQVDLSKGWKFHPGDNPAWAAPNTADSDWKHLEVGKPWEEQGYPDLDGYAWYRVHVVIPTALKNAAYLKEALRLQLGRIDDGDQVFLNGKLVGQNAGKTKDITQGQYDLERSYSVPLEDPCIHWDQDNVIAVRVFDHGGLGGMYSGPYAISIMDVNDFLSIDDQSTPFRFRTPKILRKTITLRSTAPHYVYSGSLLIVVQDPGTGNAVWQKRIPVASCTQSSPFRYVYTVTLPAQQSYTVYYAFTDTKSRKGISTSEGVPYILTPKPGPRPSINGASVFGVRPGHPLLFKVAATGNKPMRFAAANLPDGVTLDTTTGILKGKLEKSGTYLVHLKVTNPQGVATRDLRIVAGDQIALTPAMGWNSWNCWGLSVSDTKVRAAADAMKQSGLIDHGWTYINMDDGWERPSRDSRGHVVPNEKFPNMPAMTAYIHSIGLKAGIYSSPGPKTCGGYLGSYQHEDLDAATYATWGIDYLKYDWCSYGDLYPKPSPDELKKPYQVMRSSLDKVDRDILFSLCQYGMGDVWTWGGSVGGNSWRTTGDINDSWESLSTIGFHQDVCAPFTRPGNWNDPDMLVVGKVGWGPSLHVTHLTPDEQYTHISLWCLLSAPLLIGCDMKQLDDFTLNLLSNDEVLAIDQDALGSPARKIGVGTDVQIWTKPLEDGSLAVGVFNLGPKTQGANLSFADLGLTGQREVRDCWRQVNLGVHANSYAIQSIPSHGVVLLMLKAPSGNSGMPTQK